MANRKAPLGSPADLVEIFRAFLRDRLEWDRTLDPRLMIRILELAELGLEHPKAQKRTKDALDRELARRVGQLARRYGQPEKMVRRRLRAVSKEAGYRDDEALRKYIDRVRRPWLKKGRKKKGQKRP